MSRFATGHIVQPLPSFSLSPSFLSLLASAFLAFHMCYQDKPKSELRNGLMNETYRTKLAEVHPVRHANP